MDIKQKIHIALALIVLTVSGIFTFFHIQQEQQYAKERSFDAEASIKNVFDTLIQDTEHFYLFRAQANIRSEGIIAAMRDKNTSELYRLTLPRYKTLREENPYLMVMQFHAADGSSIVRMHKPKEYGDNIALKRPMLRKVHEDKQYTSGFEGGIQGIAYRMLVPVFDGTTYLGTLEFGIDTKYFQQKIRKMLGDETIMLIHKDLLGAADLKTYRNGIGSYRFSSETNGFGAMLEEYGRIYPQMQFANFYYNGEDFEINPLFLKDSEGNTIAVILCISNVTGKYQNIIGSIVKSLILSVIVIIVFWFLFEYLFRFFNRKIASQERFIETVLNTQQNIIIVTDGDTMIFANSAFFNYFGFTDLKSFMKKHACLSEFFKEGEAEDYIQKEMDGMPWNDYLALHESKEFKVNMIVDGATSTFSVRSKTIEFGDESRQVIAFSDITRLNTLATQDILTGLNNRFQFDKILEYTIGFASRYGKDFCLIMVDIDNFKTINDRYGHLVGDEVLKHVASLLKNGIRRSDVIARWGGEEFVILMTEKNLENAVLLAENLRAEIANFNFALPEQITCSFGVVKRDVEDRADRLFQKADEKLYEAKRSGKNRVVS